MPGAKSSVRNPLVEDEPAINRVVGRRAVDNRLTHTSPPFQADEPPVAWPMTGRGVSSARPDEQFVQRAGACCRWPCWRAKTISRWHRAFRVFLNKIFERNPRNNAHTCSRPNFPNDKTFNDGFEAVIRRRQNQGIEEAPRKSRPRTKLARRRQAQKFRRVWLRDIRRRDCHRRGGLLFSCHAATMTRATLPRHAAQVW